LAPTAQATGIVLGLESFAPLADGTPVDNPRCNCNAERRLKRVQRCVSRRQKGSQRRKSAVKLLAKAHQKLKRQRQRQDSHHTAALALVRQHDAIYDEDLQVRNLVRNHHLAKRISAAGWSRFLRILSFQAAYAGRTVIAVDPPAQAGPVQSRTAVRGSGKAYPSGGMPARAVGWNCTGATTPPGTFWHWVESTVGRGTPLRRERSPLGHASPDASPG
jgi:IS605 OrfB family transposase